MLIQLLINDKENLSIHIYFNEHYFLVGEWVVGGAKELKNHFYNNNAHHYGQGEARMSFPFPPMYDYYLH